MYIHTHRRKEKIIHWDIVSLSFIFKQFSNLWSLFSSYIFLVNCKDFQEKKTPDLLIQWE